MIQATSSTTGARGQGPGARTDSPLTPHHDHRCAAVPPLTPGAQRRQLIRQERDLPFTLEPVRDETSAPAHQGTPGEHHPTGKQCPHCKKLVEFWIYNPFLHRTKTVNGWLLYSTADRCCPATQDPEWQRWERALAHFSQPAPSTPLPDQAWLEDVFGVHCFRRQKLNTLDLAAQPKLVPAVRQASRLVQAFGQTLPTLGLFVSGPAGVGKSHLLSGVANAAIGAGRTALVIRCGPLLEQLVAAPGEAEEERRERQAKRRAIRAVEVLGLADLLLTPLMPSELRELDSILTWREENKRLTCFSAPESPYKLRARANGPAPLLDALLRRVERLAAVVGLPPGISPLAWRPEEGRG